MVKKISIIIIIFSLFGSYLEHWTMLKVWISCDKKTLAIQMVTKI
jgi:hypothetical protein